jgi:sugar phosphate isomerase/epimerase
MYFELLPFAKEHGVKIATENMWNWNDALNQAAPAACSHHDDFLAHIKAVNDDYLVACVDVGHAEIQGLNTSAAQMIRTLGHHVQALHLHDTDRVNDNHMPPFSMDIDFHAIVRALKDVNYQGLFTLESSYYLSSFNADNVFEGVCNMSRAARRLADMFDAL